MKTLELKQMEVINGGADCLTNATLFSLGIGAGILVLGAVTGGVGFAVAGLLWSWGGSVASVVACS